MSDPLLSIHECARTADWAGVLAHLERGASIDDREPRSGRTPLMEAVANRRTDAEFVRLLIARGADVNAGTHDVQAQLAEEGLNEIDSMVNGPESELGTAPELQQFRDSLKKIRDLQRSASSQDEIKETVLSLAVGAGSVEIVRALLDAGADIGYVRCSDYDVLIDAMHSRRIAFDPQLISLVQLLIARGAQLSTETKYGESAPQCCLMEWQV
jgi:ankyrin repeat protein